MNDQTDELLNELDNMDTPTSSQAEHLTRTLKENEMSKKQPTSESHDSSPASDDFDDLLELMDEEVAPEVKPGHSTQAAPQQAPSSAPMSELEAVAIALEAAKAAQDAAESSQKSSELAIKNAHELKAELVELSDANHAFRQLIKNESKQLTKNKNAVSLLTTLSLIVSLSAAGVMGYLLYAQNKKFNEFKGEVTDIIQTNDTLFQNKINTKVDELSSLIEVLSTKIEKTAARPPATEQSTAVNIHHNAHGTPPETGAAQPTEQHTVHENGASHSDHENHATATGEMASPLHSETHTPKPVPEHAQEHSPEHVPEHSSESSLKELGEIKQVIQQILHKQQSLEALVHQAIQANKATPSAHASPQTVIAKLSPEDAKKLAGIRWLIKVQGRQIKQIQADLKQKTANNAVKSHNLGLIQESLKMIQQQVQTLQKQQDALKKEVEALKQETQKLSAHRPYVYHAPKLDP